MLLPLLRLGTPTTVPPSYSYTRWTVHAPSINRACIVHATLMHHTCNVALCVQLGCIHVASTLHPRCIHVASTLHPRCSLRASILNAMWCIMIHACLYACEACMNVCDACMYACERYTYQTWMVQCNVIESTLNSGPPYFPRKKVLARHIFSEKKSLPPCFRTRPGYPLNFASSLTTKILFSVCS